MKKFSNSPNGFTLVELIVVITILAILGTIGFLSIRGYSSMARDSSRISALSIASKALSLRCSVSGTCPVPDGASGSGRIGGVPVLMLGTLGQKVLSAVGISAWMADPSTGKSYQYGMDGEVSPYFRVSATMEDGTLRSVSSGPDWREVDPNCDRPDVRIGTQVWAGCNSTVGSTGTGYLNGSCIDYAGTDTGWSACYGAMTRENWTGISTSAKGYSAGIPGISSNIYGALYQWDIMDSNSCFSTGIPTDNANCPCKAGYHVPTQDEWDALETALGCGGADKLTGDSVGWECAKDTSDIVNGLGWTSDNANSLRKRLGLTLAGYCNGASCYSRGSMGNYWSATAIYGTSARYRRMLLLPSVQRANLPQSIASSVRCIRN